MEDSPTHDGRQVAEREIVAENKGHMSDDDDSVSTDLTVSVSGAESLNRQHDHGDVSLRAVEDQPLPKECRVHELVKRLRSELQLEKLRVAQRNADLERCKNERGREFELLQEHVHLSTVENEALKKEGQATSARLVELHTNNLRLQSENVVLSESVARWKESASKWERKWTELSDKFHQVVRRIDRKEFTFEQFERLRNDEQSAAQRYEALLRENDASRKSADRWRQKFIKLRAQYESHLRDAVSKLKQSVRNQIEMIRSIGTEKFEVKLKEAERQRDKAVKEASRWQNLNDDLRTEIRELQSKRDKYRLQLEQAITAKNELVQRLATVSSSKSRMEKEFEEAKRETQSTINNLQQELLKCERASQQHQSLLESQAKSLAEYEETFIAIHGAGDEMDKWPTLLKVQAQHSCRMSKRVAQLETENGILRDQNLLITNSLRQLESELESKEQFLTQCEAKAPQTVGLFRDKDAIMRELRSQVNRKDLQLMGFVRQVEHLEATNKHLASELQKLLQGGSRSESVSDLSSSS